MIVPGWTANLMPDHDQIFILFWNRNSRRYAKDVDEAKAWSSSAAGDCMIARLARQRMGFVPTLVTYRAVALSEPAGPSRDACYVTRRIGVLLQTLRIDSTGNDGPRAHSVRR